MKGDYVRTTTCLLTAEEQRMLLFPEVSVEDGNNSESDAEISLGMCSALADLGASVNGLLQLLESQRVADAFPLETRADYTQLTQRVGTAAGQVSRMVESSCVLEPDVQYPFFSRSASTRQ